MPPWTWVGSVRHRQGLLAEKESHCIGGGQLLSKEDYTCVFIVNSVCAGVLPPLEVSLTCGLRDVGNTSHGLAGKWKEAKSCCGEGTSVNPLKVLCQL